MAQNPYTISRPVPRDPAAEYTEDKLFSIDRRHNGLDINPGANNHVRVVSDDSDDNLEFIRDQVMAGLFGYVPGVHQQYVRDTLRPASRAAGRDRWR